MYSMDLKSAYLYIAFCVGILVCVNFVNNVNFIKYTVHFLYKYLSYFLRTLNHLQVGNLNQRPTFYSVNFISPSL